MDTKGKFYLGRLVDPVKGKATEETLLYDPDDLTTHAVVVGMTGSGKTGLCIGMLEEAALNQVPALMIDPKGDITNTLLHFPDLLPQDFQPWVNPDVARRDGLTVEQAAAKTATQWKNGLNDWGIAPERILALKNAAQFTVYTPGSDAGVPINILASLKAPEIPWEENRELLREKISGTVVALLGLVGIQDVDPVRSREHILLSNIFEHAWSTGQDLDLGELILQTQNPPFEKLGVFDVNMFFPEKDRFALAMQLNNILASPAFQTWIEGQPLDIASILFEPNGSPRHSVFYIAHLTDSERMFFVSLLYSAVESWMRTQAGTSTLRAIVYFDEIFGYMPPLSNPPSKMVMLRMLKQARAFGVGQVLVTQNPVDLDYKALSNAGTWLIGKLQTDQDKQRLLDGLQGAVSGDMDRGQYDKLLSSLGKRIFLMHNVHESGPAIFQTRWAMNYLAGPLTRTQIPTLNQLAGVNKATVATGQAPSMATSAATAASEASIRPTAPAPTGARPEPAARSTTRPAVPASFPEYFLPNNLSFTEAFKAVGRNYPPEAHSQGIFYRPALLAQFSTRFFNRQYDLDYELKRAVMVAQPDRRGIVRWEDFDAALVDERQMDEKPAPQARFASLEAPLSDPKLLNALQKDFLDWAYRSSEASVWVNETLKLYAGPQVTAAEFRKLCADAARKQRDIEADKVSDAFDKKIDVIQEKQAREQRELDTDKSEHSQRKMEELGSGLETLMGVLGGRRRSFSKNLTKRRMTSTAKADIRESEEAIETYKKQIAELEKDKADAIEEVNERWAEVANQVSTIPVTPMKKDVLVELFGVAWYPYYETAIGEELVELPGYGLE
jgi:hypothetical protein